MVLEEADGMPAAQGDPAVAPLRTQRRGTARRLRKVGRPPRRIEARGEVRHEARRLQPGGGLPCARHRVGSDTGQGRKPIGRVVHRVRHRLAERAAAPLTAFGIEQVHQAGPQAGAADERERPSHASPPDSCSQR